MLVCASRLAGGGWDGFTPGLQERWRPFSPPPSIVCGGGLAWVQFNFLRARRLDLFPPVHGEPARDCRSRVHPLHRRPSQSLPASRRSLCLSSVLAALQLRNGRLLTIDHLHPPTPPTPPRSSPLASVFASPSTLLFLLFSSRLLTIPKPIVPTDDIFFPNEPGPDSPRSHYGRSAMCMKKNRINKGNNIVQTI